MIYIYTLADPETPENVRYVGQTISPKKRFINHMKGNKYRNTRPTNWIQSLKNKGVKPIMNIIDTCLIEDLDKTEQGYIRLFKSLGADLTNHSIGGHSSLGCKHSEESKKRRSVMSKGRTCTYSKESMDHKKKMHSDYLKANPDKSIDKILSKEERYLAALKGNKIAAEKISKCVEKYNITTGEIFEEYKSAAEAAIVNSIPPSTMNQKCTGRRRQLGEIQYRYKVK